MRPVEEAHIFVETKNTLIIYSPISQMITIQVRKGKRIMVEVIDIQQRITDIGKRIKKYTKR